MLKATAQTMRDLERSEDGAIAIITAVCCFVLFMIVGLAIDLGRVMHASNKIAASADAAALAAAKAMRDAGVSDAEAHAIAESYFSKNMQGGAASYADIRGVSVQIDRRTNAVKVDVDAEVKTTFGQVAQVGKIGVPGSATALYDSKDIELGLQLDVTGSMAGRKLADLKDAVAGAGGLLDILLPNGGTPNKIRIGLAPYASGVNAGSYAMAVSQNRATNGCVYERINSAEQTTEHAANTAVHRLKARSDLTGRGIGDCPTDAKVHPLSDERETLRGEVNSWRTSTSTAGHLGTAWAWYLISPEWATVWPSTATPVGYNDGRTLKVAVLMTDGEYNTVGGQNTSGNITLSSRYAVETCAAMKAKGIIIYTVGFEAPREAKATLTACASDASKFFDAADGDALKRSFRAIANEINTLRLAR